MKFNVMKIEDLKKLYPDKPLICAYPIDCYVVGHKSDTWNEILCVLEDLQEAEEYVRKLTLSHYSGSSQNGFYILKTKFTPKPLQ